MRARYQYIPLSGLDASRAGLVAAFPGAAPARRSHLLGAQLTSRLIFLVPEAGALLLFARFVLGVPMRGSVLLLAAVALLGALAFSGLGLLTAARPRTIEGVSGVMNLVMVPMWVFS